jgi:uncharacterized membrane protein
MHRLISWAVLPLTAGILLILFIFVTAYSNGKRMKNSWIFPAFLSFIFFIFSLTAIIIEGFFGFWSEHTSSLWGNQVWFDLLLAAGIGWYIIVPQAKARGMNLFLWGVLVVCTGCIGFTAMLARMLYIDGR